jgi:hypothetical protein
MKTPAVTRRRPNGWLAQLDRELRLHGDACELIRTVGSATQTKVRANLRCIVKVLTAEQMTAGVSISQFSYLVIISPTDLRRAKWPGPLPATGTNLPTGHNPPRDYAIPLTSDKVYFRGVEKAITLVSPVYDGDQCIRVEMKVLG